MAAALERLETIIRARRGGDTDGSYIAQLSAKGRAKIAQKVGEEAVEAVIAAMQDDPAALTGEAADLIFHLGILLADFDLSFEDVFAELARREGISGITEKASRAG